MKNLNSKGEFFQGKVIENNTHYRMPKVKINKPRRRKTAYKGVISNDKKLDIQ